MAGGRKTILNIIALIIVDVAYIPYHFKNFSTKGENSEDVKKIKQLRNRIARGMIGINIVDIGFIMLMKSDLKILGVIIASIGIVLTYSAFVYFD